MSPVLGNGISNDLMMTRLRSNRVPKAKCRAFQQARMHEHKPFELTGRRLRKVAQRLESDRAWPTEPILGVLACCLPGYLVRDFERSLRGRLPGLGQTQDAEAPGLAEPAVGGLPGSLLFEPNPRSESQLVCQVSVVQDHGEPSVAHVQTVQGFPYTSFGVWRLEIHLPPHYLLGSYRFTPLMEELPFAGQQP